MRAFSNPPLRSRLGFAKGTKVKTFDGVKPIEELVVGDLVQAHPPLEIPAFRDHHFVAELAVQFRPIVEVSSSTQTRALECSFSNYGNLRDKAVVGMDQCFYADYPQMCHEQPAEYYSQYLEHLTDMPNWALPPWFPVSHLPNTLCLVGEYFDSLPFCRVERSSHIEGPIDLYNIKVEEFNSFFVTSIGVWTLGAS